ncbi:permease [Effusibacillus pohliae]|uniref:permease n=1 Tax=Effusibacillus pohliae TaxID=232270 RepID=UPI00035F565C|nr:permease [Effusibacillus pohliae]
MWQGAQTIFLSIVLESLPFILLGVLLSSLIQELVSQDAMLRLMPNNRVLAVVVAGLLGLVLPVCDCGTIPVARSLMRKGVSVSAAMAFTLAAPVVNPLTMTATYVAFGMNPAMMWARVAATFGISVVVGWFLLSIEAKAGRRAIAAKYELPVLELAATAAAPPPRRSARSVFSAVIGHAIIEFFEVGVFVILSAAVAALLQTFLPASVVTSIGHHPVWSVLAMMGLAILLSLCSEADAFVARSLAGLTTNGGVLGFLVIGQMIDLRNMFLLPRVFPRWAVKLAFCLVIVLTLGLGIWIN